MRFKDPHTINSEHPKNEIFFQRIGTNHISQISEFRKMQYPDTEFTEPKYIQWQLHQCPTGEGIGWIALNDTEIICGEYWIIPHTFRVFQNIYYGSIGANALVHPYYRRKNIFTQLGKYCVQDCMNRSIDFTVYLPNNKSFVGLVKRLGCKEIGDIPLLIYPLRIPEMAKMKIQNRLLQEIFIVFMNSLMKIVNKNYNVTGHLIDISQVDTFDHKFNLFWNEVKDKYNCIGMRDSEYMNWRYSRFSCRDYKIFIALNNGRIVGYIVTRTNRIQNVHAGFIVDFLVLSSELGYAAGVSLVQFAFEEFKKGTTSVVCCLCLPHTEEYRLLKKIGFISLPQFLKPHPFRMVLQIHNPDVNHTLIYRLSNWYWSLGDYDVI